MVTEFPYIVGDFVWTAIDYLGEAGIGRWYYRDPKDPGREVFMGRRGRPAQSVVDAGGGQRNQRQLHQERNGEHLRRIEGQVGENESREGHQRIMRSPFGPA
jgi:hypothetical protein